MIERLAIARALHVAGVIWWIGGVAMVTTVLLPVTRANADARERLALFERLERRFARQARVAIVLVGLSGVYLLAALDLWPRFAQLRYWWLHAMVAIWAVFTLMLFVLEPWFLHRWFHRRAERDPDGSFRLMQRLHYLLLSLSLLTVLGAVAGSHGFVFP